MYISNLKTKAVCVLCIFIGTMHLSCKKLIGINEPINSITTAQVFSSDATALSAMAGIYSGMINGKSAFANANMSFSAGFTTCITGLSSDELFLPSGPINNLYFYNTNRLTEINSTNSSNLWRSAYATIYGANSVIEGIAASEAPALHDDVKNQLTAEAKFVRAFCYFYLTNIFGGVPMVLTVDFNKTQNLARMPKEMVYEQIIKDLKDAQTALASDYPATNTERIIPNKWAATLLLARVYLYTGNYSSAASQATAVINNNALFGLEPDLNKVFLTNSRETIWQLKQTDRDAELKNATPEGYNFLPNPISTGTNIYSLTSQLLSSFEPGDQRKVNWIGGTERSYYPYKYKIGGDAVRQAPLEYYVVFRLAEAYLIRAEAQANGATGGDPAAVTDLDIIRNRAGLLNLSGNINVKTAVAKERRLEFFAEWGHRWFDLKRTGQATGVLSIISLKQPWAGDYQLLYPIPRSEIMADHFLTQNPGY